MSGPDRSAEMAQLLEAAAQDNAAAGLRYTAAIELARPFHLLLASGQLKFSIDGTQWCILLGENI